jgi:hypothetical protein
MFKFCGRPPSHVRRVGRSRQCDEYVCGGFCAKKRCERFSKTANFSRSAPPAKLVTRLISAIAVRFRPRLHAISSLQPTQFTPLVKRWSAYPRDSGADGNTPSSSVMKRLRGRGSIPGEQSVYFVIVSSASSRAKTWILRAPSIEPARTIVLAQRCCILKNQ